MHLSGGVLKELILREGIVSGYDDLDKQVTANGFDVRACAFVEVLDGGKLAIEKKNHVPPRLGRAFVLPGFESRLAGYDVSEMILSEGFVELQRHRPYFVMTCERVKMPKNMMVHTAHRTSLFRFAQSLMGFGFTEAGYEGYLTFVLVPFLDGSVELGARVAQISFALLHGTGDYTQQKEFSQQGGTLF